jgi:alkylation response protein AidB-like acyl-CoA dehydrogenase
VEMHELDLLEEDHALIDLVRTIVDKQIAPHARDVDEQERWPIEAMTALGQAGLFGALVPEEYGGSSGTCLQHVLIVEGISRAGGAVSASYLAHGLGTLALTVAGTVAQKQEWLPRLATGEAIGCLAITEPGAGSDLGALRTSARRDGDDYVISGDKIFISNGNRADVVAVLARTGDAADRNNGLSLFLVERGTAGFSVSKDLHKMGQRGASTVQMFFDNVRVPASNRIGNEGDGFSIVARLLREARVSTAAQGVGLAQGAWDIAYAYAHERHQFSRPIFDYQAVQLRLANMYEQMVTARLLTYQVARLIDRDPDGAHTMATALAKVRGSDAAVSVTQDAILVLGGYGYMREYEVERYARDAKVLQIYDGTNDINRLLIMRQLAR